MVSIPELMSRQNIRVPKPDDEPAEEGLVVSEKSVGTTNVVVDLRSGTVLVTKEDGSIEASPEGEKKKDPSKDFDANLAENMDETELAGIATMLLQGIEADDKARSDWAETGNKGAEYLGIKLEDASADVTTSGSIAKVYHSMLLEAVMRSWANSRAELLPVSGPVKVRDDKPYLPKEAAEATAPEAPAMGHNGGPPLDDAPLIESVTPAPQEGGITAGPSDAGGIAPAPPAAANSVPRPVLAAALEKDMNHYLTVVDKEYYPDTSRMLFSRALLGCQFKKVYRCPLRRRPVSVWVKGTDLIVSNDCSHLSGAGRVTERILMRKATVLRMMKGGHWIDTPLVTPSPAPTSTDQKTAEIEGVKVMPDLPEDYRHTIYECYTELMRAGLGKDETGKDVGYPLPYRVTMDKDSRKVLEIRRNWKQGDTDYRARRRYVKFGFVPGLGFYDLGFIHILGNPQKACTAMERMLIDAGMFASFPGGVMVRGPGSRQTTSEIRVGPSQFMTIDTGGMKIQDVIMPLPYKEPSQTLFSLLGDISAQGRRLAGILELPVGEGRVGDVPVGTIMSYIDSISKVPSAVHKDDHMAQQEEFELLKELFREDPEDLHRFAVNPAHKWLRAEELDDHYLVPAADPNVPSQMHRIIQAQALAQAGGLSQFMQEGIPNQRGIWEWTMRTLGVDPHTVTSPPKPPSAAPPDPKVMAAQMKAQTDMEKTRAKMAQDQQKAKLDMLEKEKEGHIRLTEAKVESADKAADRASRERTEQMKGQNERMKLAGAMQQDMFKARLDERRNQQQMHHDDEKHRRDMEHSREKMAVDAMGRAADRQSSERTAASKSKPKGGDRVSEGG